MFLSQVMSLRKRGDAVVISSDSWEAVRDRNESLRNQEVLEEFSVYDYYDIETVQEDYTSTQDENEKSKDSKSAMLIELKGNW